MAELLVYETFIHNEKDVSYNINTRIFKHVIWFYNKCALYGIYFP